MKICGAVRSIFVVVISLILKSLPRFMVFYPIL